MSVVATILGIGGGILVAKADRRRLQRRRRRLPRRPARCCCRARSSWRSSSASASRWLSVIVPARRAAKIPPVAAMRPELGFEALQHAGGSSPASSSRVVGAVAVRASACSPARAAPSALLALAGGGAPADLPRRGQRLVDRRPPGDQADRLAGRQGVQDAGRAGPGERRPGAAAHVGDGRRADDRRRPRQRGGGVRLVAAGHVLRDPRASRQGRLHHHRRVVPGAAADRRRDAGAGARAVGASPPSAAPPRSSTATRRRSAPSTRWRFEQLVDIDLQRRRLPGARRRRHPRPQGPGEGPRPAGRRHGRR